MTLPNIAKTSLVTPVIPVNAPVVIRIDPPAPKQKSGKSFSFNVEKFLQFLKDESEPEVVDVEHTEL